MARVTQVRYVRKINLGNYETQDIEFTAAVDEGECPVAVFYEVQAEVLTIAGRDELAARARTKALEAQRIWDEKRAAT